MSHSICNSHATVKSVVVPLAISANLKYQRHYHADCSPRTQIRGGWTLQVGEGFCVYLCKEGEKVLQGLINMQIFRGLALPLTSGILSMSQTENGQSRASLTSLS